MDKTLLTLARAIGMTALDVGSRGGVNSDLFDIAPAVNYIGFEPDATECSRLNAMKNNSGFASTRYLPVALAAESGEFSLNLYSKRGCSSKYKALQESGALFSRAHYYELDKIVKVPCQRLDDLVVNEQINDPAYMKIDVQSMEVEVFNGAEKMLQDHICAIRTEVSFFPMYENQPLFAEIDQRLRRNGFVPMRWLESHEWRRSTTKKPRTLSNTDVPYSRGQLIHSDILYLYHPEYDAFDSIVSIKRLIRLGILSACFEHYDHAMAAFSIPKVRQFCLEEMKLDPASAVKRMSQMHATLQRKLAWRIIRFLEKHFA